MNGAHLAALLGLSLSLMLALRGLEAHSVRVATMVKIAAVWIAIIAGVAWIASRFT